MTFRVAALLAVWALAWGRTADAADIHLSLDNNLTVLLHDDHTWTPSDPSARRELSEMSITLEDGQAVFLSGDGSWSFVVDENADAREGYTSIFHQAVASGESAIDAGEMAEELAIKGLMKRLEPVVPAGSSFATIKACLEDIEKDILRKERKKGAVYEVTIKMTLDADAIDGIIKCIELSRRLEDRLDEDSAAEE